MLLGSVRHAGGTLKGKALPPEARYGARPPFRLYGTLIPVLRNPHVPRTDRRRVIGETGSRTGVGRWRRLSCPARTDGRRLTSDANRNGDGAFIYTHYTGLLELNDKVMTACQRRWHRLGRQYSGVCHVSKLPTNDKVVDRQPLRCRRPPQRRWRCRLPGLPHHLRRDLRSAPPSPSLTGAGPENHEPALRVAQTSLSDTGGIRF